MMLKRRYLEFFWFLTWCFISPMILLILLIRMIINPDVVIVNGKYLPDWANTLGWIIMVIILLPIPAFALHELFRAFKIRKYLKVKQNV